MEPTIIIGIILLGLLAGYLSGLVGIGGGIVMVPVLVLLFGFTQHKAQGTTLALLNDSCGNFRRDELLQNWECGHQNRAGSLLRICSRKLSRQQNRDHTFAGNFTKSLCDPDGGGCCENVFSKVVIRFRFRTSFDVPPFNRFHINCFLASVGIEVTEFLPDFSA